MEPRDEDKFDFDPLDVTKIWPEHLFPLQPVGRMVLNKVRILPAVVPCACCWFIARVRCLHSRWLPSSVSVHAKHWGELTGVYHGILRTCLECTCSHDWCERVCALQNPDNFFNENEQLAFCPALIVPGAPPAPCRALLRAALCVRCKPYLHASAHVSAHAAIALLRVCCMRMHFRSAAQWHLLNCDGCAHVAQLLGCWSLAAALAGIGYSDDKLLQTRIFSYADTQRHRLGPNYLMLPANAPKCAHHNNHHDGFMNFMHRDEEARCPHSAP